MAVLNDICSRSSRDGLDRLVQHAVLLGGRLDVLHGRVELHRLGAIIDDHPPDAVEKAAHAADAVHAPRLDGLQRAHEHLVEPQASAPYSPRLRRD